MRCVLYDGPIYTMHNILVTSFVYIHRIYLHLLRACMYACSVGRATRYTDNAHTHYHTRCKGSGFVTGQFPSLSF